MITKEYPRDDVEQWNCLKVHETVAADEAQMLIPVVRGAYPQEPERELTVRKMRGGCFGSQDFMPWKDGGTTTPPGDDGPPVVTDPPVVVTDPPTPTQAPASAGLLTVGLIAVVALGITLNQ